MKCLQIIVFFISKNASEITVNIRLTKQSLDVKRMAHNVNSFEVADSNIPLLGSDNEIPDMRQRRKSDYKRRGVNAAALNNNRKKIMRSAFTEYPKFIFYCMLLIVPLYAIAKSIINHDWFMVAVNVLLLPVGFVHGILLLLGLVN